MSDCEPSGLPVPICRGSICDCFDHEDVEPASGEECEAYFGPHEPIATLSPRDMLRLGEALDNLKATEDDGIF